MMKERPILFSAAMVRAILEGRKLQTRRVLKVQPPAECGIHYMLGNESWLDPDERTPLRHHWEAWHGPLFENRPAGHLAGSFDAVCPYGMPGDQYTDYEPTGGRRESDRLWVRETWRALALWDDTSPSKIIQGACVHYDADGPPEPRIELGETFHYGIGRPAIFMPRWASRITLEVTGVRVERVQDISEEDARAEGVWEHDGDNPLEKPDWSLCPQCGGTGLYDYGSLSGVIPGVDCTKCDTFKKRYGILWDHINGKRDGCDWASNPYVWVIDFKRIEL